MDRHDAGAQEFAAEKLPLDTAAETGSAAAGSENLKGPLVTLLSPERYQFGFIDRNSKMNHTFEIRNDGDAPLTVRKKGTSCKCTSAGLDKDQLLPGETAKITLEWTGKGMTEFFEQYAEYETNDIRRPTVKFVVAGRDSRDAAGGAGRGDFQPRLVPGAGPSHGPDLGLGRRGAEDY